MSRRKLLYRILAPLVVAVSLMFPRSARAEDILISAAASLTDVMRQLGGEFSRHNPGVIVRLNLGSSGALQRQIENGAPADVFCPAGTKEMDQLSGAGRVDRSSRIDFAGNRLVLIVPIRSTIHGWADLARPSVNRIALSNPDSVPSGRFARETLLKRRLWDSVQGKAVFGQNVRQTLAYVARGDADAGIVFATDALIEHGRVKVAQAANPGVDHAPIVYPAAVISRSAHAALARRFVAFLRGPAAQDILRRAGFTAAAHARR